MLMHAL